MRITSPLAAALLLVAAALPALAAPRDAGTAPRDAGSTDAGTKDAGVTDAGSTDAGDAGPDDAGDAGAADDAGVASGSVVGTCVEHVPPGARRPAMTEELPLRGLSGYAVELRIVISHGKGETVLPEGFHLRKDSDELKALEKAGFVIPDPEGGVAPKVVVVAPAGGAAVTTITIPVVPLPPKPGRQALELPPLPIAISRASNEYVTVCTAPHRILIEDPIANELDPKVKPNPPGRKQLEDWPFARMLVLGVLIGAVLVLLGALSYRWWSRRPKFVALPPKVAPWITALEELDRIRRSPLLDEGRRGEHFDRVSDALRRYLGARYGFDALGQAESGLETTTGEMLDLLKRVRPPIVELPRIKDFLDDCDLVKFARFTPSTEQCLDSLARGESIVRRTIPVMQIPKAPDGAGRDGPTPPGHDEGSAPTPPEASS